MKADLHIHSNCSDGSDSPEEIVAKAQALGIGCVALTDHDNVDGVERAQSEGKKRGMQVVTGLELSTYSVAEIHILGYCVDVHGDVLCAKLAELRERRRTRIFAMADRLAELGMPVDVEQLHSVGGSVGRPHLAHLMMQAGYVSSVNEAFDRYLGEKGKAYIPSRRITPIEGVKLIKAAGGVPVLAHPMLIKQKGRLADLVEGLIGVGLRGIETYYPSHTAADIAALTAMAKKYRLLTTGGSDYHGTGKAGDIGCSDYTLGAATAHALGIKL